MLELRASAVSVVCCAASPDAVDAAAGAEGAAAYRLAPDEVLLVAGPEDAAGLLRGTEARATGADPDALVLDVTDGWAAWTLAGDGIRDAFARLSALELPEKGFVQGDVAHVPVKAFAADGRLDLLVPAMWSEHLRGRILRRCASLGVRESAT